MTKEESVTDTPGEREPVIRPFADWFVEHAHGETATEAAAAWHDLIEQVQLLGKAGTLTMTVKANPVGKGGSLAITVDIATKPPKADLEPSLFYIDEDGNLTRQDPRQQALGFPRAVPTAEAPAAAEGASD